MGVSPGIDGPCHSRAGSAAVLSLEEPLSGNPAFAVAARLDTKGRRCGRLAGMAAPNTKAVGFALRRGYRYRRHGVPVAHERALSESARLVGHFRYRRFCPLGPLATPLTGPHQSRQDYSATKEGPAPGGLWEALPGNGGLTGTASFGGPHGTSRRDSPNTPC